MISSKTVRSILGKDYRLGFLLVTPFIALVLGLIAYPFASAIAISMTDKTIGLKAHFIGARNYIELWSDPFFRQALTNTIKYTSFAVAGKFTLGMGMALALNRFTGRRDILGGILIIPWIIPGVVVAVIWLWMYEPLVGLINYILVGSGVVSSPPGWLGDYNLALFSLIVVNIWRGFAFYGVAFTAGLKTIPQELYEAANIDGAGSIVRFRYITLPGLVAIWPIVLLLSTIWTFTDFVTIWAMTKGGPAGATHILGTLTYEVGIGSMHMGKGVAISLYSMPLLLIIIVLYTNYALKRGA